MHDTIDLRALLALADTYYEAMVHGSVNDLVCVFDAEARFQGMRDGQRVTRDLPEFIELVRNPDATTTLDHHCHAEVLDLAGPIAVVKVVGLFRGRMYTDYLSALETPEGWKIVNKTFWAWNQEFGPDVAP
jgi:hypothetical protein